ncbi:DUF916 domain-containing protein [Litchfieldia alkalitelluris]|uniref:DUF916 domain-containing protein n=1 Tax=Litchfieldia alkalitelluris TaxID=304268 RepID=UPI0009966331|nr:DUF916 domain-containing protein [Litchfieldia alkalitelluris]
MKLKRVWFWVSICILYGVVVFFVNENAKAQETNLPLSIEPIYPKNHNPQIKGYFDLTVNPGDEQSLSVRITNKEDEEVTVSMKSANAYTNPSGGMMYEDEIDSPDTGLLNDAVRMAEYIKIEETVTVPPLSSVDVPIEFSVPGSDGQTLLGGILFTTQGDETEQQQEVEEGTANFVLKTETVYAIAVQLNLPTTVTSNFFLGEAGFIPETAQVFIEMTNDAQKIQEEITGTYSVSDQEGNKLFNGEFGPFKMAPKSKIRYPFQWGHDTLEDGNYTLNIKGNIADRAFSISKVFTIKNKDVEEYVEKTQPNVPQANVNNGIPIWVWIISAVLFGIVMFVLGKRKK